MGDGSVWVDFGDSAVAVIWRWTIGGFGDGFLFPRGPFLRRQESHSVVHATIGKNPPFRRQLTPPLAAYDCEIPAFAGMVLWGTGVCVDFGDSAVAVIWRWTIGGFGDGFLFPCGPFLRRQESHSVVHATIGKNPPFCRQLTPPLAAYDCEIPAYAGMVYLCTDDCGRIRRCLWYDTVRFLFSQEWSTCVRTIVGEYGVVCGTTL